MAAGIILTGGSAKVMGLIELAEEIFHMPVRLGVPQHIIGLTDVVENPIHSTGVGLLLYGRDHLVGSEQVSESGEGAFSRMKGWFQRNF